MSRFMKPALLFTLSLCAIYSSSAFADTTQCSENEKQINSANNAVISLISYNGPIKSIVMTSSIPADGRFKALKGEMQLDECGNLLKDSTSIQEYIEGYIETNRLRTSPDNPYILKYQFQKKNSQYQHSLYMQETYQRDNNNRLNKKITQYYGNEGDLLATYTSRFQYKDGLIISEITTPLNPEEPEFITTYTYNAQGKLLKAVEDQKTLVEYQYDDMNKIVKQINKVVGMDGDIKTFISTCTEWDKFNNCITEQLESTIKFDNRTINYSKATIHNQLTYYK